MKTGLYAKQARIAAGSGEKMRKPGTNGRCVPQVSQIKEEVMLVKSPSKGAFRKNIKAEIKAEKPPKQAVAIAYAVKRSVEKGVK